MFKNLSWNWIEFFEEYEGNACKLRKNITQSKFWRTLRLDLVTYFSCEIDHSVILAMMAEKFCSRVWNAMRYHVRLFFIF